MLMEEADETGGVFMLDLQRIQNAGGQLLAVFNDGLAPWRVKTGKINLAEMRNQMRPPIDFIVRQSELCQNIADNLALDKFRADLQKISGAAMNLLALFDSKSFPTEV